MPHGLTLHPDKTRLIDFRRPAGATHGAAPERQSKPGTFDLLGFTHYWGRSVRGHWVVKRKTASDRFGRALGKIGDWLRRHCHLPVAEQHRTLSQKLRGHDAYYGLTGNLQALQRLRYGVVRLWWRWLGRRRRGRLPWPRFAALLRRFALPAARVVHSVYRLAAKPTL